MEKTFSFKRLISQTKVMLRQNKGFFIGLGLLNIAVSAGFIWFEKLNLYADFDAPDYSNMENWLLKFISDDFTSHATEAISIMHFVNIFFTFFFVTALFSFLFTKRKVDFFHSCPVTRTEYFLASVLSSTVFNAFLIAIQMAALYIGTTDRVFDGTVVWLSALLSLVSGTVFAAATALCAVCEGTLVSFLFSFASVAFMSCVSLFFFFKSLPLVLQGYVDNVILKSAFIPQFFFSYDNMKTSDFLIIIGIRILILALVTALGIYIYSQRKSERSGDIIASPLAFIFLSLNIFCFFTFVDSFITFDRSFPFVYGSDISSMDYTSIYEYTIPLSLAVLAVGIGLLVKDKISVKKIAVSASVCVVLIAAVALSCTIIEKNAYEFSMYVPESGEVESVSVKTRVLEDTPFQLSYDERKAEFDDKETIETAVAVHKRSTEFFSHSPQYFSDNQENMKFEYKLKNGKKVSRFVPVTYSDQELLDCYTKLCENDKFEFYNQTNGKKPSFALVKKEGANGINYYLKGEDAEKLYDAFVKDKKNGAKIEVQEDYNYYYNYYINFYFLEREIDQETLDRLSGLDIQKVNSYYLKHYSVYAGSDFKNTITFIENLYK